jgi:hypothetical protein
VDDPASATYRRPDLTAQYRERAEREFNALMANAGITPPMPPTPQQLADERFEAAWNMTLPETLENTIDEQLELEEALHVSVRAEHVAALRKEYGNEEYERLVAQARASLNSGEKLPDAALSNKVRFSKPGSDGPLPRSS